MAPRAIKESVVVYHLYGLFQSISISKQPPVSSFKSSHLALEKMHHPFLITIAEWAWSTDPSPQVTPTVCLASLPFLSSPCFMRLLAKLIGISIIAASCINKGKDRLSLFHTIIKHLSTASSSFSFSIPPSHQ